MSLAMERSDAPPQLAPVPDEVDRQRRLDQMKRRATGLLVIATVIYIVTRLLEPRYSWLGFLRAMAEAAMIGGLADWFAVTALFRHPMGIPIPHTAIIPARKDRVARTLGAFVQHNFLTREVIQARLSGVQVGERIAGKLLSVVTEDNRHQELLNEAIILISRSVEQNHDLIRDRVQRESPWWVPTAVDDKIFEKIVRSIERTLGEIRDDPQHPLRERFDNALRTFIDNLQNSPETVARAEALKAELLDAEAVRRFSASLWVDAKAALVRFAENAEATSREGGTIERALTSFGEAVLADPALMRRVDEFVIDIAAQMVERYQREIADLITHTVQNWDAEVTTRRIELAIGRDLQYIRINGTLVGALAGLLIYSISRLLP